MSFTEFYCDPVNGSNLNAGSTTDAAAVYTATNGGWNATTGVFTPASGDPSATVSVGMFASVYLDAATVGVFVGRVTGVNSTTITVSLTAKMGTAPATNAAGRTIKVGGAWKGPNGEATDFPYGLLASTLTNAAGDTLRVNFKNSADYLISGGDSLANNGPYILEGYTTSPGDGGRFVLDAQDATFPIYITGANISVLHCECKNSADIGFYCEGAELYLLDVVSHDCQYEGFYIASTAVLEECEAYNTCESGGGVAVDAGFYLQTHATLKRCVAHDNTEGAGHGFYFFGTTGIVTLIDCIADDNAGDGIRLMSNAISHLHGCDCYSNGGDGVEIGNTTAGLILIENCNFFSNGGYGINGSGAGARIGAVINCAFGSGTKANTSGTVTGLKGIQEIGTVTYTANETPWNDPANGDFTLIGALCRGTGRGLFTQTATSYGGTVSKPDIGAASRGGTFPATNKVETSTKYGAAGTEYTGDGGTFGGGGGGGSVIKSSIVKGIK